MAKTRTHLLFSTYKLLSNGHNTLKMANYMVLYSVIKNSNILSQAKARIDRQRQPLKTYIYPLQSTDQPSEEVRASLRGKREQLSGPRGRTTAEKRSPPSRIRRFQPADPADAGGLVVSCAAPAISGGGVSFPGTVGHADGASYIDPKRPSSAITWCAAPAGGALILVRRMRMPLMPSSNLDRGRSGEDPVILKVFGNMLG